MTKIKSLSLHKFDYVLKDMSTDEFELKGGIYNKITYDPEGRTLSELKYNPDGSVEQHYGYVYNEQGIKIADRSWDENGDLIDDMEYDVDADGKTQFAYKNYLDGSKDTVKYRYDDAGKLIEKEVRSDEDEVEFLEKFSYEGDREIMHESWGEDGESISREETLWNEKGNILETKTWMAETQETERIVNEYDENAGLSSVASYDESGGIIFKVEYKRDDQGEIVEVREESPEKIAVTIFEYDEHGNAGVQEERNEHGEINSRIERKFDKEGNVTESEAILDRHGMGRNQHYVLKYEYEYFDE
ncbi:MAG: RHS repeat protein [Bacteroidetes bacterium]|nr:RHS repeat protein [Bacteroidota bacterium]